MGDLGGIKLHAMPASEASPHAKHVNTWETFVEGHFYFFTIKFCAEDWNSKKELHEQMLRMVNIYRATLVKYSFEHDSLERNHIHGIFHCGRKNLKYTLCKKYGVHFDIQHIDTEKDFQGYYRYICKENWALRDQQLYSKYIKSIEYPFR